MTKAQFVISESVFALKNFGIEWCKV